MAAGKYLLRARVVVTLPLRTALVVALMSMVVLAFGASPAAAPAQTGGTVAAWGYDDSGQSTAPAGPGSVKAISAGAYHSMAIGDVSWSPVVVDDLYDVNEGDDRLYGGLGGKLYAAVARQGHPKHLEPPGNRAPPVGGGKGPARPTRRGSRRTNQLRQTLEKAHPTDTSTARAIPRVAAVRAGAPAASPSSRGRSGTSDVSRRRDRRYKTGLSGDEPDTD